MKRRDFLQTLGLAAAGSCAVWSSRGSTSLSRSYLQLGTSISAAIGRTFTGTATNIISERLGMLAINGAIPGSCACVNKHPELDQASLYALADAISSGDWSLQRTTGNSVHDEAISIMRGSDLRSATHIGLEYGANDYRYDRLIGNDEDLRKETFKGALNYSIRKLQRWNPAAKIFLISPWWMPTYDERDSDIHPNGVGLFLRDYVSALFKVAEINNIPCLDMWSSSGVSKANHRDFTTDGVHPNDAGIQLRARLISLFIAHQTYA